MAKDHNNGVQDGHVCVIFCHDPKPEEVWLNLSELVHSPEFLSALAGGNYPAIQYWMNKEHEVILEVPFLSPEDVYSWGEKVSDVDELKRVAAVEGCSPEFISTLEDRLKTAKIKPGQDSWFTEQKAKEFARKYSRFA